MEKIFLGKKVFWKRKKKRIDLRTGMKSDRARINKGSVFKKLYVTDDRSREDKIGVA